MTKAERAIKALREAADALDELPMRRHSLLGDYIQTQNLRDEADWLENQVKMLQEIVSDVGEI